MGRPREAIAVRYHHLAHREVSEPSSAGLYAARGVRERRWRRASAGHWT